MTEDMEEIVDSMETEGFDEMLEVLMTYEAFIENISLPEELKDAAIELIRSLLERWEINTDWEDKFETLDTGLEADW